MHLHHVEQRVAAPHTETYQYLLTHYGPLLTLKHLAEVMHSSPNGMRMAIARRQQPMAVALAFAKRQIGRRVFFEARLVAEIIDAGVTGNPVQQTHTVSKSKSVSSHESHAPTSSELVQRD